MEFIVSGSFQNVRRKKRGESYFMEGNNLSIKHSSGVFKQENIFCSQILSRRVIILFCRFNYISLYHAFENQLA